MPFIPVWDDHEVKNGWSGRVYESGTVAQRNVLAAAEAAANVWMDAYQPPNENHGGVKPKPDAPDGYTNDQVNYFYFDTARSRFLVFDTRRFKDNRAGSRQHIGPAQLQWAVDLLENTQQPFVFLASPVAWTSLKYKEGERWLAFEEYKAERQSLFDAATNNPAIEHLILLSADNHYAVVADPDPQNERLGSEFLVGAFSIFA